MLELLPLLLYLPILPTGVIEGSPRRWESDLGQVIEAKGLIEVRGPLWWGYGEKRGDVWLILWSRAKRQDFVDFVPNASGRLMREGKGLVGLWFPFEGESTHPIRLMYLRER